MQHKLPAFARSKKRSLCNRAPAPNRDQRNGIFHAAVCAILSAATEQIFWSRRRANDLARGQKDAKRPDVIDAVGYACSLYSASTKDIAVFEKIREGYVGFGTEIQLGRKNMLYPACRPP